jgi:carbonic anhydrase
MDIIYRYDPYKPITPRQLEDASSAIEILEHGHDRYVTIVTQVQKELLGDHSAGQIVIPSDPLSLGMPLLAGAPPVQVPFAVVLGCSDARVPVEQIFDQSPNDLFVIRVAGNVLGVECLGSIDYAVNQLGGSLKLLVVLGHSSCGAVTAAVDSYLAPRDYASIALTHALRSLVDRIQVAVRGAATALERVAGAAAARHPSYREALVETAIYLNAAITAYDVRREVDRLAGGGVRVVYGVFDLVRQRVRARPAGAVADAAGEGPGPIPVFADVPSGPDGFGAISAEIAGAVAARRLQPAAVDLV